MIPSAPITQPTADTLHLMAADPRKDVAYVAFLSACKQVADANDGLVLTNEVRALLCDEHGELTMHPRLFSAFFCRATAKGGPLAKTGDWSICADPKGANTGRPQHVRRWVAPAP